MEKIENVNILLCQLVLHTLKKKTQTVMPVTVRSDEEKEKESLIYSQMMQIISTDGKTALPRTVVEIGDFVLGLTESGWDMDKISIFFSAYLDKHTDNRSLASLRLFKDEYGESM
jgi:hypothetical protein